MSRIPITKSNSRAFFSSSASTKHVETIPYEVRATITKEVRKPPNLFDYLCYLSFGILIGILRWKLTKIIPSRH